MEGFLSLVCGCRVDISIHMSAVNGSKKGALFIAEGHVGS